MQVDEHTDHFGKKPYVMVRRNVYLIAEAYEKCDNVEWKKNNEVKVHKEEKA